MDKENVMSRLLYGVLVATAIVVLAACSTGSAGRAAQPSVGPDALRISATNLVFSTSTLSAPADEPFQIAFDNQESAPHNVAIYRDSSATEKVFGSDPFSGPAVVVYDVPALAAGTYFFRCDVHPEMSGQLIAG
jgi:plastocyanin